MGTGKRCGVHLECDIFAPMNSQLLQLLSAPQSHAPLELRGEQELFCAQSGVTYAVSNGIPVLLPGEQHLSPAGPVESHLGDYTAHYQTDAEEFDYFEERFGATLHDERRVYESILAAIPRGTK